MRRSEFLRWGALALSAAALGLSGCVPGPREIDLPGRRILVPAAVGGGYDVTARTAVKVLASLGGATGPVEAFNVPGAGGLLGLERAISERGHGHLALMTGLGVIGAGWTAGREEDVRALTPIARVTEEPGVVLVDPASPYDSIDQALDAWIASPRSLRVGVGSSRGGPDNLFAVQIARRIGIRLSDVSFVEFSGGSELLSALLTRRIDLAFGGAGEIRPHILAGAVRALAVSSMDRLEGIAAPTLRERGLGLVFRNWRGFTAPPGIPDDDRERWEDDIARMCASAAWKEALVANGWIDAYLPGDAFGEEIAAQIDVVTDTLRDD
jgi:putative tricarboxylic transport membrane protein